ncbi:MAG TPA: protein kinase, partial [Candidatus Eisenbacteria bacterium]|nr:protein kinase [Candidatus Eisenbacteria bacterium]
MSDLTDRLNAALAGRYAIQRELGAGGMAKVFLAEDVRHRRLVAIKVVHPELAAEIGSERFLREIEIAASLHHPHILPLYDSGSADHTLYYVMPFVDGESLRARLERERQLPVQDSLRLAGQIASALDYAHRRGVIHRDIKPENILLADGQAVVADFGIARAITAAGGEKLTKTGTTLGTPTYMSPEQAFGSGAVDGRSDLYSLACVLYEMLSGEPPFTGATGESVVHQHLNVSPRRVSALRTSVPKGVDLALETALSKAPADRFKTASEFAAAIATTESTIALRSEGSETEAPLHGQRSKPLSTTAATIPMVVARGRRRTMALAVTAVAAIALAVALWQLGPWRGHGSSRVPAKKAWILVAEFDGPAADSSLIRAARDLVMAGLDQSEIASVVPSEQIRVALQRAGRPTSSRVDAELARELAFRSSVRTVLEGRIGRLGKGYSLVLRVVDVDSARVVVSLSDAASDEDALIPTVSRATRRLRSELGESAAALQATRPLQEGITPSLEAFKLLLRARELLSRNDQGGAITLARSALAHDPDLSSAWGVIGYAFMNQDEADSAMQAFHEALACPPERLPQASRLFYESALAGLRGDHSSALSANERLVQLVPDNAWAHNNLGSLLADTGRLEDALESYLTAEEVSPFGPNQQILGNRFWLLLRLGRLDEARKVAPRLTGSLALAAPMQVAQAAGQWSAAESLASALRRNPGAYEDVRAEAVWTLAAAQASRGQVKTSDETLRQLQLEGRRGTLPAHHARWRRLMLALFSRGVAAAPREPGPWDSTAFGLLTRGAWAAAEGDTALARRLLTQVRARSPSEVARLGFGPEILQGWVAARAGHWEEVVRDVGPAARQGEPRGYAIFRSAHLPRWLVAEAYERLGQPDSAAAYFERAI